MLVYSKAIGANTDVLTAQAFIFESELAKEDLTTDKQNPEQILILLISGIGDEAFVKVRKVGLDARDFFYQTEASTGERITQLILYLKHELQDLEQLSVTIGLVEKDTLYIETVGQFSVLLWRQNHLIQLSRGLDEQKLISGILEVGDRILFLSSALTEEGNYSILEQNLVQTDLDNLEFELEAFIQAQTNPDPIAAVLLINQSKDELEPVVQLPDLTQQADAPKDYVPAVRLDGARVKTPSFFLLVNSFWQHLALSKKQIFLGLIILGLIFLGGKFIFSKFNHPKITPQASNVPLPANTIELTNFPILLDLSLVKDNFTASRISLSLGRLAILDTNSQSLIAIDIHQKQPQILAGFLQLGQVKFVSINGDFIYAFSADKGILRVDAGNGKTSAGITPDSTWQKITDLKGFANNIYLLDEYSNQIWKYIATDTGFSSKNQYLNPGVTADFAGGRNLQIDGSVWVLKGDNQILKFTQGATDFFQISGVNPPMDQIKSFYVADDTNNMYWLDHQNSRVVVTDKKGQYLNQYLGDKFKDTSDLVVDEPNKKLYLLERGKIYQVDLR